VQLRKTFFLREVSVPQSDYLVDVELPCEIACDPPVSEVHEIYIKLVQMLISLAIR
jgi:hypothetical protein